MNVTIFIGLHDQETVDRINGLVCTYGTFVYSTSLMMLQLSHPDRPISHLDAALFVANFYQEGFSGHVSIRPK